MDLHDMFNGLSTARTDTRMDLHDMFNGLSTAGTYTRMDLHDKFKEVVKLLHHIWLLYVLCNICFRK